MVLVILIGMMGAGKTTVGREYARRHRMRFIDCDHEIEARTGVKVSTIFEIEGEEGFRRRETQLVDELTRESDLVLATGGGVVLNPDNRAMMSERGIVVYLNVPTPVLWERTRHDRNRPLLQVPNPRERIENLYRERDPLYRSVADIIVDGGRGNPGGMVRVIEKAIENFKK
ncbi:shikimate kinase [Aromatoleum toluolicum]|uniref:Shikimate kinase n=3 Tax=Aromatoleum toluolicum TaxID=90060 RepID=A0ABX1NKC6_9RHOO|nr:shikimate kinase [Aromatoleum toluolicum]NMF99792.1 shikimate kinase [Aromatoleum toluolicum]